MATAATGVFDSDTVARRRFRTALGFSLAGHVIAFAVLFFSPPRPPPVLAPIVSVELIAALPKAPPSTARKPKPAASKPALAPAPPVVKKKVLPKEPAPLREKPKRAKPAPQPVRREPPKELEYEDALASLRSEMGESAAQSPLGEARRSAETRAAERSASAASAAVDRELANWVLATRAHVRRAWVTPPEFLNRGLQADLRVTLMADGTVLGAPEVVVPSGDPYFDENAVRALRRASPLPPPPEAGEWPFRFEPEGSGR